MIDQLLPRLAIILVVAFITTIAGDSQTIHLSSTPASDCTARYERAVDEWNALAAVNDPMYLAHMAEGGFDAWMVMNGYDAPPGSSCWDPAYTD